MYLGSIPCQYEKSPGGRVKGKLLFNGYRGFVGDDEKILDTESADS